MSARWKRNTVVVTMALLVCAAVALNWKYTGEQAAGAVEETGTETSAPPGTIAAAGKQGIDVACGDGKLLRITELQAQGGKRMAAAAYLLGHPISL